MQTAFEGLDYDAGREIGPMEATAQRIVADYETEWPDYDPIQAGLLQALRTLAQNIDVQNRKGREISRNMAQWLDTLARLSELHPADVAIDDDVASVWSGTGIEADA
ncbi:hypothetical protein PG2072B_1509 [Bifidobacterium pseudolongum subsp. globosum]|uniref:Uncharacterized protein n=1 Tax=Bifidobacterium pseudolongum subsp. globosum TaxID=1690 RepID=A0A4Q5BDH8_9BIFI|nr:hypothetical protein [Bifidobacterium pseudolongum]RYQ66071.1 hypothetical protein PG2072B_1509 [Bifidobacterium pseudolongum subsp. globosum]